MSEQSIFRARSHKRTNRLLEAHLGCILITLEQLDLLLSHQLVDDICLGLLERKSEAFVRVILLVGLILIDTSAVAGGRRGPQALPQLSHSIGGLTHLVVQYKGEIRVFCSGIKDECHESVCLVNFVFCCTFSATSRSATYLLSPLYSLNGSPRSMHELRTCMRSCQEEAVKIAAVKSRIEEETKETRTA